MAVAHNLSVTVLYEGNGWAAVEKPAGMSVHNDPGHDLCSCAAFALFSADTPSQSIQEKTERHALHPVHRLDRQTSGVVLLAYQPEVLRNLSGQFAGGHVGKEYIALLHGHVAAPARGKEWGVWQWRLSNQAAGRKSPRGTGPKADCRTRYRILEYSRHYSMVACRLDTGRKHQIRRHAKLAGHPVVGDSRYGSLRSTAYLEKKRHFSRLGLHADRLEIRSPQSGETLVLQSTGVPEAIQRLFRDDTVQMPMPDPGMQTKQ